MQLHRTIHTVDPRLINRIPRRYKAYDVYGRHHFIDATQWDTGRTLIVTYPNGNDSFWGPSHIRDCKPTKINRDMLAIVDGKRVAPDAGPLFTIGTDK